MTSMEFQFLSVCYVHIHFHLTSTVEVSEMYEENQWSLRLQCLIIKQSSPYYNMHWHPYKIKTAKHNMKSIHSHKKDYEGRPKKNGDVSRV